MWSKLIEIRFSCSLCPHANYSRTEILQIFKGQWKTCSQGIHVNEKRICSADEEFAQKFNTTQPRKNSDIHGRYLFKPLVLKKLLCTDLIHGLWYYAGILSVNSVKRKNTCPSKEFCAFGNTFNSAVSEDLSLWWFYHLNWAKKGGTLLWDLAMFKSPLCLSGTFWDKSTTILVKSSPARFSLYFLKYLNPKLFKLL